MKENRYKALDGLRFLFCIFIVWGIHYYWIFPDGYGMEMPWKDVLYPFYKYGYFGVEFFFILSGFGMASSYKEKCMNGQMTFVSYIKKRIIKLFPLMLITTFITLVEIVIYYAKTGWLYYVQSCTFWDLLLSCTGMSSGWFYADVSINLPLWYVSCLFLDYIIFYFVCKMVKGNLNAYCFVCVFIVIFGITNLVKGTGAPFLFENSNRAYMCFFWGCILYEVNQIVSEKHKKLYAQIGGGH